MIALDTRGHGKSPRGDKPFTIRQFAEDLRAFLDEQGIERADLLGFSDGGNIALIFAMRYPQRVDVYKRQILDAVTAVLDKADKKGIEITTEPFADQTLWHNRKWTAEVLVNLLENAVKYPCLLYTSRCV